MALVKLKPTSPGRRHAVKVVNPGLHKGKPFAALLEKKNRGSGRNNNGHITCRHKGGGSKRHYRVIDFLRNKDGVPARVERIEYDPNRSAHIALVLYADGERRYIICPKGLNVGDTIMSGQEAPIKVGNALRNERNLATAQLRERRGILAHAVEPDCSRDDGIGLIEAQNAIGQKALARTARTDDCHNLARMHRNRKAGNHAHVFLASTEKMRFIGVVHGKRHAQILNLQQMMPMRMVRRHRMGMVMVHRTT